MSEFTQSFITRYIAKLKTNIDAAAAQASQEVGKAADKYAFEAVIPELEEEMKLAYWNATSAWYRAYVPKEYGRSHSLYDALKFKRPGDMSFGWEYKEEDMVKPSWNGGSYNIYGRVFNGGSHGGPVHGHPPVRTTAIPVLFDQLLPEVQSVIQDRINDLGQEYYATHFEERINQIIRNMP